MKRKILIGDADPPVRIMLARVFKAAGFDVLLAEDPREAICGIGDARPDLVLLDLPAPDAQSWEPFEKIMRSYPAIPIIATTSFSNQQEAALQRSIDALMEKPLDLAQLLDLASQLIAEPVFARAQRRRKPTSKAAVHAAA